MGSININLTLLILGTLFLFLKFMKQEFDIIKNSFLNKVLNVLRANAAFLNTNLASLKKKTLYTSSSYYKGEISVQILSEIS